VTAESALLVALGALVGAPLRFVVERRLASSYPWGTWIVNVAGSAVLGATAGYVSTLGQATSAASLVALVGTGFCGSLTTFGGFAAQVLDLAASPSGAPLSGRSLRAVGYGTVSLVACVAVAAMFYVTTASLSR
jgi:fluoride exporter